MPKKAVQVKGYQEFVAQVNNLQKDQIDVTNETYRQFGPNIVTKINSRTPVRTGRLKKGNSFKTENLVLRIFNPVHYAPHVNFGTVFMPARRFHTDTIDEETPKLEQELTKKLGQKIKFRLRK